MTIDYIPDEIAKLREVISVKFAKSGDVFMLSRSDYLFIENAMNCEMEEVEAGEIAIFHCVLGPYVMDNTYYNMYTAKFYFPSRECILEEDISFKEIIHSHHLANFVKVTKESV